MQIILRRGRKREDAFKKIGGSEVVQVLCNGECGACRFEPLGSYFLHLPFSGMEVEEVSRFKAVL
jgi:hypothetical protein